MSRYEFGPEIGAVSLVAPAADGSSSDPSSDASAPVAKQDVQVAFAGVDSEGNFSFSVPKYDPSQYNALNAIHVSLYENNADGTAPTLPTDPSQAVGAALSYSVDTSTLQSGGTAVVDATEAPEGDYTALSILEFAQ